MACNNINHHSVIKIFLPQPLSASFPSCISSVDSTNKYLFVLNIMGHSFHGIEYKIYFCIVMQDNLSRRQNYGTTYARKLRQNLKPDLDLPLSEVEHVCHLNPTRSAQIPWQDLIMLKYYFDAHDLIIITFMIS